MMATFDSSLWGGSLPGGFNATAPPVMVADLIYTALRIAGVLTGPGRTPSPEQAADAFATLNAMLDSWATDALMVPAVERIEFPLVDGQTDYTFGLDSADVEHDVPQRIVGFGRVGDGGAERVHEVLNLEQWRSMRPGAYYQAGATAGRLSIRPTPAGGEVGALYAWSPIPEFATTGDAVILPRGYRRAIEYNLAVELAARFPGAVLKQEAAAIAVQSKMEIKSFNDDGGELRCDSALLPRRYFDTLNGRYI